MSKEHSVRVFGEEIFVPWSLNSCQCHSSGLKTWKTTRGKANVASGRQEGHRHVACGLHYETRKGRKKTATFTWILNAEKVGGQYQQFLISRNTGMQSSTPRASAVPNHTFNPKKNIDSLSGSGEGQERYSYWCQGNAVIRTSPNYLEMEALIQNFDKGPHYDHGIDSASVIVLVK